MEGQLIIEVPNFSDPQYSIIGHPARYVTIKAAALECIEITIFPNGDTQNHEGHVSIVLHLHTPKVIDTPKVNNIEANSDVNLECTVSVVDANGRSLYPQSFGIIGVFEEGSSLREVSFVRRCVVLDPHKELLLDEDTLTLQFDFTWDIKRIDGFAKLSISEIIKMHLQNLESIRNNQQCLNAIDPFKSESKHHLRRLRISQWEDHEFDLFKGYPQLSEHPFVSQLQCDDSPLCERLRDKPKYYESLFRKVVLKGNRHFHLSIEWEIRRYIFRDLMIFLQEENLGHVDNVEKCIALYYLSHKYGMPDLKEICSERLKCLLTCENAVEMLDVAEMCKDVGLRTQATVQILLNSNEVQNSTDWTVLRENRPYFAKKVSRMAHDIEIQNLGIESGLRRFVLQYVFLNWDEVKKYTRWKVTTRKLIASCLRKDFDFYLLDLNEFDLVEKYKKHAEDYNFYT